MTERCGKWMPRLQTTCVRPLNHPGSCRDRNAQDRKNTQLRIRRQDPLVRQSRLRTQKEYSKKHKERLRAYAQQWRASARGKAIRAAASRRRIRFRSGGSEKINVGSARSFEQAQAINAHIRSRISEFKAAQAAKAVQDTFMPGNSVAEQERHALCSLLSLTPGSNEAPCGEGSQRQEAHQGIQPLIRVRIDRRRSAEDQGPHQETTT